MKNVKTNLQLIILAVGVVAVWRGVWGFLDLYLFPDDLVLSYSISIIAGLAILYFQDHKVNELL